MRKNNIRDYFWLLRNYIKKMLTKIKKVLYFEKQFIEYNKIATDKMRAKRSNIKRHIEDFTKLTQIEPVYFYQDAWAFEEIMKFKPSYHIDIGSHHKYVSLLSKVVPLTMIDIRPLSLELESIKFIKGSILEIPFEDNTIESLSSLCVIEHIGLGRYGDKLDPYGTEKAIQELKRVIKDNGHLYISVPIEKENVTYFNAHRAFNENYLLSFFENFTVINKKYIYGNTYSNIKKDITGIGCYHLVKNTKRSK